MQQPRSASQPLRRPAAFYLQASLIVSFLAGSSAPTPLYALYEAQWGFTPVTVTVVFGVYALAVLAALLIFGRLSDYIGRRPVLLAATLAQAVTMAMFAAATGVPGLVLARIVQGVATGAAAGAIGAGMLDIDRMRGTVANAVGPMLGTATGGILSGLVVQWLPAPEQFIYLLLLAVFLVQAWLLLRLRESVPGMPGALASLRPRFALPGAVRAPMAAAAPALVAAWALVGFYGSLGPTLVRRLAGGGPVVLGGLALFVLAGSGALGLLYLHPRRPRWLLQLGTAALAAGVGLTGLAMRPGTGTDAGVALAGFFAGTALAGVGFGAAFQGVIRSVVPLARPQERAGVLSVIYIVSYLAMGLPAVLGGLRVSYGGGLLVAAHEYALAVVVLAVTAWLAVMLRRETVVAPANRCAQRPADCVRRGGYPLRVVPGSATATAPDRGTARRAGRGDGRP